MKPLTFLILLVTISKLTYSQSCEIKCFATQKGFRQAGPKVFTLYLERGYGADSTITQLWSNGIGTIYLDSLTVSKIINRNVIRFEFSNKLDLEYYRIPRELGTFRRVSELCGKTLIVEPRF